MTSTLDKLAHIIHVETGWPTDILTLDKTFTSLDIDSLSMITILVNAEDEFGISLVNDAPQTAGTTVGNLVEFIDGKLL